MVKNLKHGMKISKKDVVLKCCYFLCYKDNLYKMFDTKLDVINCLSGVLLDSAYKLDDFTLLKVQNIKIN